jgi:deoxyribodipyrimidine photo-lyase
MRHEPIPVPRRLVPVAGIDPGDFVPPELAADHCPGRQPGGRAAGVVTLRSFLAERGRPYRRAMSAPVEGAVHCSRLSPHLAWGTLSIRETLRAAEARLRTLAPEDGGE